MNFFEAIKSGFFGYINFSGRACRSEYWWFLLFYLVLYIGAMLLGNGGTLFAFVYIGFLLPLIALQVRRLHDINRTGWWILISIVPFVGAILLLVFYCTKGTEGDNRFGFDPLGAKISSI